MNVPWQNFFPNTVVKIFGSHEDVTHPFPKGVATCGEPP